MGLFDIFKKRGPNHAQKLDMAYKCYKPETVGMLFPGGKEQADKVIISLARIFGTDLEKADAKQYFELLSVYSDVVIRRVITRSSDEHILTSLQSKHQNLVKDKTTAQKALAYISINMANHSFVLNDDEDMAALSLMTGYYTEAEQFVQNNASAEKSNLNDPEYGFVVSKPIYTNGVDGSKIYLQQLETNLGKSLSWERLGSTSVDGINGMIDIYTSFLPSGDKYKTLYVNMYGSTNSTTIPKGFRKKD